MSEINVDQEVQRALEKANAVVPVVHIDRHELAVQAIESQGIADEESLKHANQIAHRIVEDLALREKEGNSVIKAAHKVHKWLCDGILPVNKRLTEMLDRIKVPMAAYVDQRRAERQEHERELAALREKAIRDANKEAKLLMAQGHVKEARKVIDEAEHYPMPEMLDLDFSDALAGTIETSQLTVEITSVRDFCRAVADGEIPLAVETKSWGKNKMVPTVTISESCIKEQFRRQKESLKWPGVKVERKTSFSFHRDKEDE
jgi:hypothetical protein